MRNMLNHRQVASLIKAVGTKRTVIVVGENGCSKTSIQQTLAADPDFANHDVQKPLDCTQLSDGSIWMPDIDRERGVSRELPNERLGVGPGCTKPVVLCADEVLKCSNPVKQMLAPIFYERRVGIHDMPKGSIVWGTSNLAVEGLNDTLAPHLRSRIIKVYLRKPTQAEWKDEFAVPHGVHPAVIAFTDREPQVFDSFLDYEEGGKYAGASLEKHNPSIFNPRLQQDGYASPRTLHAASDVMYALGEMDAYTLRAALEGTVGQATANQMLAYVNYWQDLPAWERVVQTPDTCPVPDNATAQLIMTHQCVNRGGVDRDTAQAVMTYVKRLRTEMQAIFLNTVIRSKGNTTFSTIVEYGQMLRDKRLMLN
jgi:hypothetical protein